MRWYKRLWRRFECWHLGHVLEEDWAYFPQVLTWKWPANPLTDPPTVTGDPNFVPVHFWCSNCFRKIKVGA